MLITNALAFLHKTKQECFSLWVNACHVGVIQFYEAQGFRRTGATSTLRPTSNLKIVELVYELGVT